MLATWGTSTGFNPASLFSGGVQGAWYDPSDNLTMFQEAGGKTPVTAVEQAVGLILDKSVPTQTTGYYSGAFDGSSDLLSFADNVALQMGTGDFTIEFWINFASISGFQTPYEKSYTDVGGLLIQTGSGTGRMIVYASNVAVITETGTGVANTWIHYALVRNSGTLKLYRDGVETGSVANATNFNGTGTGGIGARSLNGNFSVNGYMSNVRVVKGTAVYTAPFTPPTTPLTAISGTSLLALQNNRFIDNSANAFTLNVSGNPGVNLFNPFNSTPARMVNNAYQFTSASRPTLRARYNLLTYSEQFNDAAWTKQNTTVTANATTAPDGTLTADKVIPNTTLGAHALRQDVTTLAQPYVFSIYAKASEYIWLILANTTAAQSRTFNLQTGVVGTSSAGTSTATITSVGNGWYRCTITGTATAASNAFRAYVTTTDDVNSNFSGDDVSGMFMWGAQVVPTAVFPSNVYQRIAASTDYATGAAFPQYLAFDGTDDSLLTANVDFATVTSDGAARRNLLLNPTQFDAAGWTLSNVTITANAAAAPDGTTTAYRMVPSIVSAAQHVLQTVTVSAVTYTQSIYAKASTYNFLQLLNSQTTDYANFDLTTGTVGTTAGSITASIQDAGNGWYRCIVAYPAFAAGSMNFRYAVVGSAAAARNAAFQGNGTDGILIWGAQLETGSTATAFQNIGTDKMTVWSGLSKLSDAAAGTVVELSATLGSNNGTFLMRAPDSTAPNYYGWYSKGTVFLSSATATSATYAAPATSVLTGIGDIGIDSQILRINAVQAATAATDQGTGNYLSYPLYIGRRNNATLPFNGRIYSLIVRGAASNSSQVAQTERYVASKTPLGVVP